MRGVTYSVEGRYVYKSTKPERMNAERGRESFRMDVHPDGGRTLTSHAEIDDTPPVVRDVDIHLDAEYVPQHSSVRIFVGGNFRGAGWFRFSDTKAECESFTALEGRVSQQMHLNKPLRGFGNHAIVNDGFLLNMYDLSQGPGVQVIKDQLLLSSPDHRGATGPMLFAVDLAIEYVCEETITVASGNFKARHFRMLDVPGLPEEHPEYNIWLTADDDHILLKANVGGYMQTAYELTSYQRNEA